MARSTRGRPTLYVAALIGEGLFPVGNHPPHTRRGQKTTAQTARIVAEVCHNLENRCMGTVISISGRWLRDDVIGPGFPPLSPVRFFTRHGAGHGSRTWTPAASTGFPNRTGAPRDGDNGNARLPLPLDLRSRSRPTDGTGNKLMRAFPSSTPAYPKIF